MCRQTAPARISPAPFLPSISPNELTTAKLTNQEKAEVLEFLDARPLHTVALRGYIIDNGIVSPLHRGIFYSCRNSKGELEGVALIGHAILMETRTERALRAFAELARKSDRSHMIMGEEERVQEFWHRYSEEGQQIRRVCRELLYELNWPVAVPEGVSGLRLATMEDLNLLVPVHAQMAFEESGTNPLEKDAIGFRERCARRIEDGRSWVCIEDGKLVFKADVIADTPTNVYVEGIWVSPDERGQGNGLRCMSQLARTLLGANKSMVLLVNENNIRAHRFYSKAGYKLRAYYDTIFLM